MSKNQVRLIAATVVLLAATAGFLIYRSQSEQRQSQLFEVAFARGTPRQRVVSVLGEPDQEFTGAEMQRLFRTGSECSKTSSKVLRYFSRGNSLRSYCAVYLDAADHVVCVEHGLIAV
jgi:hypothetical protein